MSAPPPSSTAPGYPGQPPPAYPVEPPPSDYSSTTPQYDQGALPPKEVYSGQPQGAHPPTQPYPQPQPYQQQGYPQTGHAYQHSAAPPVVVTQPRVMVHPTVFGSTPVTMTCPQCQAHITTTTQYKSGTFTWIICLIICGVGFLAAGITWFGCCLIPFCVSSMKDVIHVCPNCHNQVGRHDRKL